MADFTDADLHGSQLRRVDLTGALLDDVDLTGARLREVDLTGVVISGAVLHGVDIDADIRNVVVNGVDVVPYVEAELDRRYPDRAKMRPTDPAGFREAWDVVERLWDGTMQRARRLPPEALHESVAGEWSFISTLRHLVFATDSWVRRALLGDPAPWHPLGLPWDQMPEGEWPPRDREARPSLDEVTALRRDRMDGVRAFLDTLTDERLAGDTVPVEAPGWPRPESYPVRRCLLVVLNEEWQHRLYAERDLAVLEQV